MTTYHIQIGSQLFEFPNTNENLDLKTSLPFLTTKFEANLHDILYINIFMGFLNLDYY